MGEKEPEIVRMIQEKDSDIMEFQEDRKSTPIISNMKHLTLPTTKFRIKKSREIIVSGKKAWVGLELENEIIKDSSNRDLEIQKTIDELDILLEEEIRKEQRRMEPGAVGSSPIVRLSSNACH